MLTRNQLALFFLVAAGLYFMDLSSRQFSHSRHFVFVSLGGDRRDSPCQLPPDSSLRLSVSVTSEVFSAAILQTWQALHVPSCLNHSPLCGYIRKLSPTQTGYLRLFEIKLFVSEASSWLILSICQVRYTGYRDRPIHERQNKFLSAARDGSTEIVSILFIILTL